MTKVLLYYYDTVYHQYIFADCTVQNNPKQFRTVHLCECSTCKKYYSSTLKYAVQQYCVCTAVHRNSIILYTKPSMYHCAVVVHNFFKSTNQCVGDHIRRTAYYIISGEYPDINVREIYTVYRYSAYNIQRVLSVSVHSTRCILYVYIYCNTVQYTVLCSCTTAVHRESGYRVLPVCTAARRYTDSIYLYF
jgi:hypothetical protein